jgi:hypothetical protein
MGLLFTGIVLITVALLIFTMENYQSISADRGNHNNKNNYTDSKFFLPFNSNFADQLIGEKKHSIEIIPFL